MENEQHNNYSLAYILISIVTFVAIALSFAIYRLPALPMLISILIVMAGICFVWSRKLSKKNLYVNNVLILLVANMLAYFFTDYLIISKDRLFGFVIGVAVVDVFSFTKRGKHTLNAKLAGNVSTLARLSICLPIPGKPGLQQIIGVGDLVYYSTITMFFLKAPEASNGLIVAILILVGQFVNIISTMVLKKLQKEQYRGFPATLFPGVIVFIASIIQWI